MQPLCCVSPTPDHPSSSPNNHNHQPNGLLVSSPSPISRSDQISLSSNQLIPASNHHPVNHHRRFGIAGVGGGNTNRQLHHNPQSTSIREQPDLVDVKINDIVGSRVFGILYKWVNYSKGWRPRWFVLQDCVLAYYKIHGPDRIVVNKETEKGAKVIGEDSRRRVSRNGLAGTQLWRKPFGEVHLKVFRCL